MKNFILKTIFCFISLTLLFSISTSYSFSAYRTDSSEVQTKVGNPTYNPNPQGGNELSQLAYQIAQSVITSNVCNRYVTTFACINEIGKLIPSSVKYPELILNQFYQSVSNWGRLECGMFAQGIVGGVYGAYLNNGGGYAGAWVNNPPSGYRQVVKNEVAVGDIYVLSGDPGHIAIVTGISQRDFTVSEANYPYLNYPSSGLVNNQRSIAKDDPSYFIILRKI